MRNILIIIALLAVIGIIGFVFMNFSSDRATEGDGVAVIQTAPEGEAIDTVTDFVDEWHEALQSTSTDPFTAGLNESPALSAKFQQYLADNRENTEIENDLVLCQPEVPDRIGTKVVFEQDFEAQMMVIARGVETPFSSIVTVVAENGEWVIDDITCSAGDIAPEREFAFDNEGFLLKDSLPETFDKEYWHLVFTQDDTPGFTAPLFFTESSSCTDRSGDTTECGGELFTEASKVSVQGNMTESGPEVVRLQFVE